MSAARDADSRRLMAITFEAGSATFVLEEEELALVE
jgi:hypothetical protein